MLPTQDRISTADMNDWPAFRILFSLTQNFMRHRRRISFAKRDVLQEVRYRIPFAPAEINVRHLFSIIANKEQESGYCIGHCGRDRPQHTKTVHLLTVYVQHTGKLRSIAGSHFEE